MYQTFKRNHDYNIASTARIVKRKEGKNPEKIRKKALFATLLKILEL
jgi:hypothetical protein